MDLTQKKCVPCEGGAPAFSPKEVATYLAHIQNWTSVEDKRIKKDFAFHDFKEAMEFVNKVAKIAESEGHHPDIHVFYNRVQLELWTHAVSGLSENDFILAAKIDILVS